MKDDAFEPVGRFLLITAVAGASFFIQPKLEEAPAGSMFQGKSGTAFEHLHGHYFKDTGVGACLRPAC